MGKSTEDFSNHVWLSNCWKVVLEEDSRGQYDDPFDGMTFNNISPAQIAEMRARRILLDEPLKAVNPSLNQPNLMNQTESDLDFFIGGGGSSYHETGLTNSQIPIPALYQSFGQIAREVREICSFNLSALLETFKHG